MSILYRHSRSILLRPAVFVVEPTIVCRAHHSAHLNGIDPVDRLLVITLADGTTPVRTRVLAIGLQEPFLPGQISIDSPAHVANRDVENTFPGGTLRRRVSPTARNGVLGALLARFFVVVETGGLPGIQRGVDDILR